MHSVSFTGGKIATNGNFLCINNATARATITNCTMTGAQALTLDEAKGYDVDPENAVGGKGGALYVRNGIAILIDTVITGNQSNTNGAGIYVTASGKLTLAGKTSVTGNTLYGTTTAEDIYLETGATLTTTDLDTNGSTGVVVNQPTTP